MGIIRIFILTSVIMVITVLTHAATEGLPEDLRELKVLSWELNNDPEVFIREIARHCLTTPESRVGNFANKITVRDNPVCNAELYRMSLRWDYGSRPDMEIAAIYTESQKKNSDIRKLAKERGVASLSTTSGCSCVAFIGHGARDLVLTLQSDRSESVR